MLALCLIFFASGAAALLFETLWFRQAGLMLGNSVWASSLVVSSFMGGLALGNGLAGRHGSRLRRPVLAYAGIEAVIAVTGVGLVLLFPALPPLLAPVFRSLLGWPAALNALRLAVAFVLMVVPATAMGATLPVLVRALTTRDANFGRALGRLYGWNTLGAVAGGMAGELALVGALGVRGTGLVAGALDAAAALGALALSRGWGESPPEAGFDAGPGFGSAARALLAAAFLSGGILLALEVVWFRFLVLFVYGNSLTFAIMLSTVLFGIGAGGLGASWWLRWRSDVDRLLPFLALAAGLLTAHTYVSFADFMRGEGVSYLLLPRPIVLASSRLILPVALLSGVLFTFLGRALKDVVGGTARAAGALTLANTTGAMLGALLGGFVLLPGLGIEISFFLLAAAYGLVAFLAARARRSVAVPSPGEARATWLAGAAFVAFLALFPFGLMRNHYMRLVAQLWTQDGSTIAAIREGLTETIVYLRKDLWGQPLSYRLVTNGFSMSGTSYSARRYMNLFVYWPLALNPEAKRALLISYGVGSTAKALTDTRGLESIDVVDISRDILELSRMVFPPPERHPLDDPRVRVHVEDGRFFLLTSDRSFDLITGEPPPPKVAGIVNLYSREYFRLVHDRLAGGGVATYWLPLDQMEGDDARAVIRAFCDAFEDCSLWSGEGPQFMLAGSRGMRGPVDEAAFRRQWSDPVAAPTMRALGFEKPEQLGTFFVADAPILREISRDTPPLDDDHPLRMSHRLPNGNDPFFVALTDVALTRRRFSESRLIARLWPQTLRDATLASFEEQGRLERFFWGGFSPQGLDLEGAHALITRSSLRTPILWLAGSSADQERLARMALALGASDPLLEETLAARALADRDYRGAERHFHRAQLQSQHRERLVLWRILCLHLAGEDEEAVGLLRTAREGITPKSPSAWTWLANRLGQPDPFAAAGASGRSPHEE